MNDNQGHSAGDKLIKDAANILKEGFKKQEIYRAGGDEFMVLLRDITLEYLQETVVRLKSCLHKQII